MCKKSKSELISDISSKKTSKKFQILVNFRMSIFTIFFNEIFPKIKLKLFPPQFEFSIALSSALSALGHTFAVLPENGPFRP